MKAFHELTVTNAGAGSSAITAIQAHCVAHNLAFAEEKHSLSVSLVRTYGVSIFSRCDDRGHASSMVCALPDGHVIVAS